jgi:digeranylgeranylglycerophospholipid reductase
LDRSRYDADLAEKAAKAGADLALSSRVVARKSSKMLSVRSREEMMDIKARVIVGADGPASIIARSIGASYRNRERDLSPSLHRVLSDVRVDPRVTEMIFGSQAAPGGYSWIIPSGRSVANVGVGVRRSLVGSKHSLRDCLDHVVQRMDRTSKMLSEGRIVRSVGALIPVGGPVRPSVSRNTIIVGDAAGHVMASNGGGIPTALGEERLPERRFRIT